MENDNGTILSDTGIVVKTTPTHPADIGNDDRLTISNDNNPVISDHKISPFFDYPEEIIGISSWEDVQNLRFWD